MDYQNERLPEQSVLPEQRGSLDVPFLLLVLLLLGIGVIMVLSASFPRAYYTSETTKIGPTYYFTRQLIFALGGVGVMLVMSKFPMYIYRKYAFAVLGIAIVLLVAVPFIGVKAGGARRWIDLGFTTFQPSEIAKISVVLVFSSMIAKYRDKMKQFRYGMMPFACVLAVVVGLLILEPHLSASVIILVVGAALIFVGGGRTKWFVIGLIILGVAGTLVLMKFGYASDRVTTWLDPLNADADKSYQIVQSLYTIGSGGLMGLGLGQGRQKYLYLPEEHNDFIFSIVCEELGFVGAVLILLLFALLVLRGYWLAMHCRDRFSFLVCTGITTLLAVQVIFNVAVVTNLIPCTGISLPFFSYGGTALLLQMAEMGILLSASRNIPITA